MSEQYLQAFASALDKVSGGSGEPPCEHRTLKPDFRNTEEASWRPTIVAVWCPDCDKRWSVATPALDRLQAKDDDLEWKYGGAVESIAEYNRMIGVLHEQVARLQRMAEAGEVLAGMAKEMLEWAGEEHTDTCPLYQEHADDDTSCDCLLGDMRRAIAKYEEACREDG